MSDKATLKSFFETNDFPTQAEFADWIDSYGNFIDDEAPQLSIVTITSPQVLALFTTPISLVAAGGAGTYIKPLAITAKLVPAGAFYTVAPGSRLEYHQSALSGALEATQTGPFVPSVATVTETGDIVSLSHNIVENVPLVAAMTVGNPTVGNGTIQIHTLYSLQQF